MVSRKESSMPLLKPIACTYNPSPGSLPICPELPGFSFMKSERSGDIFARASSSIEVDPISLGIPWPTSFPLARQCKHWIAAIQSGKDLLEELYYLSSADEKKLPQGLFTGSDPICLSKRGNAAVENAVNAAIYMNPEASQTKILLIVRAYLLLWLLGDVVEVFPERAGFTAMDIAIAECPEIAQRHSILPTNTSSFAADLINEDPILGLEFFKSIVDWSYTMRKKPQNTFSGLRDFLNCRSIDVADDMLWRCARFSSGARLSQAEEEAMRPFERLVMDHIVFTNDIYSFDKEKEDFLSKGATFLNTVHYLEQALSVRSETAKSIAFHLVSEVEIKLEQELIGLKESSLFGQEQVKYAHALIEMAAGNVFYSATSARYGRKSAIPFHRTE